MKLLIPFLLCPFLALADVRVGDEITGRVLVCQKSEDAIAILEAHVKNGIEAAADVYANADGCGKVPLRFRVGKEVKAIKVEKDLTIHIIAIHDPNDESLTLYWLTEDKVVKKGERNT